MYAAMVLLALALPPVMLWPWGLLVEASLPLALFSILHVAEVYNLGPRRAVRFRFYVTITFASLYAASIALAH
jgi:1,4-dihydroxy-2-naphthoate octaprenyltransferase